jgi:hypothetical protein
MNNGKPPRYIIKPISLAICMEIQNANVLEIEVGKLFKKIVPRLKIFKIQKSSCKARTGYKLHGYYFDKIIQIIKA